MINWFILSSNIYELLLCNQAVLEIRDMEVKSRGDHDPVWKVDNYRRVL